MMQRNAHRGWTGRLGLLFGRPTNGSRTEVRRGVMHSRTKSQRSGFTLVEVLVTLLLISLLIAAVVPQLVQQIEQGEPVRAAQDLAAVKTGLETFKINVRLFPSDLEDLANPITTADEEANGTTFLSKHVSRWLGPYIDKVFTVTAGHATGDAFETGFNGQFLKQLACYHADSTTITAFEELGATGACDTGEFVTVLITGLSSTEFDDLNDVMDGTADAGGAAGRLRSFINGTAPDTTFFLAIPFN
ncbi:MAG: prepilin-type N-terminal cleavage/methylation domain-containing protein [Gemmatimonadetes bacterium]|nr:prepilin-type N-terminal cleavage/methylation domain-containing protein [Gemmatimonadota bacterium]